MQLATININAEILPILRSKLILGNPPPPSLPPFFGNAKILTAPILEVPPFLQTLTHGPLQSKDGLITCLMWVLHQIIRFCRLASQTAMRQPWGVAHFCCMNSLHGFVTDFSDRWSSLSPVLVHVQLPVLALCNSVLIPREVSDSSTHVCPCVSAFRIMAMVKASEPPWDCELSC